MGRVINDVQADAVAEEIQVALDAFAADFKLGSKCLGVGELPRPNHRVNLRHSLNRRTIAIRAVTAMLALQLPGIRNAFCALAHFLFPSHSAMMRRNKYRSRSSARLQPTRPATRPSTHRSMLVG